MHEFIHFLIDLNSTTTYIIHYAKHYQLEGFNSPKKNRLKL